MPVYVLWVKAELENVAKFWAADDATWTFDVKHGSSDEARNGVVIDPDEVQDVPNTKNTTANFMLKFEGEKTFSYLKVLKPGQEGCPKTLTLAAQTADGGQMAPFFACECRGMEPVKWTPTGPYCVESPGGETFSDIDLRTEDWCEYDEKSGESMVLNKEIAHEFRLFRGK